MRTDLPPLGRELYAHAGDGGDIDWVGENFNVVERLANAEIVSLLHGKILDYIRLIKEPAYHSGYAARIAARR
eukprot:SAG31_NODE_33172_length_347_cov_0.620968_1_plen_72_part_01